MTDSFRVVVDTNVLISRLLAPESTPARAVSHVVRNGRLLSSEATLEELAEVLSRAKFDRYLSMAERQQFIRMLARIVEMPPITHRFTICDDPSDDKFLELAVSGAANAIVTGDRHLLDLHPFRQIPIMNPGAYLNRIEQDTERT